MSEDKKSLIDLVPDSVDNAVKNITDKPTQNMGTTLADIWYLVFGGISQAAEKRKLKYSYALQEFEKELKEKISKIPEDKLIEPDIQIIAPALESSKYCIEKENLRKMYANLIVASMNSDTCDHVHPIFSSIISQMSSYDGKILESMYYAEHKEIEHNNNIQNTNNLSFEERLNELNKHMLSWMTLEQLGLVYTNFKEYAFNHLNDKLELEIHFKSGEPIFYAKLCDLGEIFCEICVI